jgi:hypothetical protein
MYVGGADAAGSGGASGAGADVFSAASGVLGAGGLGLTEVAMLLLLLD